MGLDQYWIAIDKDATSPQDENWEREELGYHRKFNALEGFMAEIWHQDIGTEFNCEYLPITQEIVGMLEEVIENDDLEPQSGFFFGSTAKDEWYREDIRELTEEILPRVKARLIEGKKVFYTSWW